MKLQVALDLVEPFKALELARALCREDVVDIVEAGTPLIKSAGITIVSALKMACPDKAVIADTKTADVGALEARLAFDAGADAMTVLALASNETIAEALEEASRRGREVIIDLIHVKDPLARLRELMGEGLKPHYVCFHLGIDVQRKRGLTIESLIDEAVRAKELFGVKIAVAGGIDENTLKKIVGRAIDVVIVGRAITGAPNPVDAARRLKALIPF